MLELAILIIAALANIVLGLLVYVKHPRGTTNRLFLFLAVTFVLWSLVNFVSVHPVWLSQLTWARLVLFFSALLNLAVFLTFLAFPHAKMPERHKRRALIGAGYTALVMCLTLTPLIFKDLTIKNGVSAPEPGPAIPLFAIQTLGLLGVGIYALVVHYRRSTGRSRDQYRIALIGVAGTYGLIVITNFLLVVIANYTVLIPFGPALSLLFCGSFTYAIVKHRLFDIRKAAARAVGYVLTLGFLAGIYFAVVLSINKLLANIGASDNVVIVSQAAVSLVLAFMFQPIKRFFDRTSNRIFYRDAYDPKQFIDHLNRALVEHSDIHNLLKDSLRIIETYMKAGHSVFAINQTAYLSMRIVGAHARRYDEAEVTALQPLLRHVHSKIVVTEYLESKDAELAKQLTRQDIAVVVRLVPSIRAQTQEVGALLLGPKKSGDNYSQDDIDVLNIVANELVIAIQNALRFEEIENFNQTLQQKVTTATRQLRHTNEKLKQLDETKDDFISMASHQLRTPLTSVKGYISMVLEEDVGKINKQQREMLGQAFFSSQRMVYLIADLLNVSRLKTGKFIVDARPLNLDAVVQQELEQLKETAAARSLTLNYEKPDAFPSMMLDETKTRQVIMNFVDNAIYYTPAGGLITVRLVDKPHAVELRIIDNGIGVPKAEQPHLFTKFYRAGNARQARPDGTGLGLFMAKKIIVAQGGSLIFESKEGEGSTFGFAFSKTKKLVAYATEVPLAHHDPGAGHANIVDVK